MSIADGWMANILRAVTCPLFSSNGMHAVIIFFSLNRMFLLLLKLSRYFNTLAKIAFDLKVLTVSFMRNFFH